MDRRSFLTHSIAASLGSLSLGQAGCAEPARLQTQRDESTGTGRTLEHIGVQLYTVRDLMEVDVAHTLERVAAVGYDEVEFAGYFEHTPAQIRGLLDQSGLRAPAAHVDIDLLRTRLEEVLEAADIIGHSYLVCPWLRPEERTLEHYRQHANLFNEVGAACRTAGIQFAYHNHDFEFEATDGQVHFDLLLDRTEPDLVQIELDLYWLAKGDRQAEPYFDRHPGRFPLCHVKDMAADETMVSVGQGELDFASIFGQSEQAGLKHYFVEHDTPQDSLASIQVSFEHLQELRF